MERQSGYLKKRGMRVALDTTYILGRGAVKDTYNLLADGIVKLLRVLAAVANTTVENGPNTSIITTALRNRAGYRPMDGARWPSGYNCLVLTLADITASIRKTPL